MLLGRGGANELSGTEPGAVGLTSEELLVSGGSKGSLIGLVATGSSACRGTGLSGLGCANG